MKMGKRQRVEIEKKCFLDFGPLISIVIPIYNTEKYLSRCVESVLNQSYRNLEIILVNDGSTDNSQKIIDQYCEQDLRVKSVTHDQNRGLFQARLSGADIATGKYLAFVDSDDYICFDWFRALVKKAEEMQSDITVGEWCFDFGGGNKAYLNLDPFRLNDYLIEGDDVVSTLMEQEGRCYSWTVVWNKLYLKTLWDQSYPDFLKFSMDHGHMLMWEDIVFSIGLWVRANKIVNVHNINYFYFQHGNASTSFNKSRKRNLKYLNDASAAVEFVKKSLENSGKYLAEEKHFKQFKRNCASIVYNDLVVDLGERNYKKKIQLAFDYYEEFDERNTFFYKLSTPLQPAFIWLEDIKREIVSDLNKIVSFDVFDTLIQRPFMYPTDLFELLTNQLNKETSAFIDFTQMRINAEKQYRKKIELQCPSKEDITLDEIYSEINLNYIFPKKLVDKIEDLEKELEINFCYIRQIGKDLFELAKDAGKKIIICSDMYLPKSTIEKILDKNGYKDYKKLYLSSDIGLTKAQKSLYQFVKKDLCCKKAEEIFHVGDNWASDVENARACGWRAGHLSKSIDMLQNLNPGIYSGESYQAVYQQNHWKEDNRAAVAGFLGIRSILAISANRFFDNPYVSFHPQSDFNANPNFIGYYALGPHLLSICNWILKIVEQESVGNIHFVARDGYLVKQAYDLLNRSSTQSTYIRLSRKSLLLADVNTKEDLYSISRKLNTLKCSPKDLTEYFEPIIPTQIQKSAPQIIKKYGFYYERIFKTNYEYEQCLRVFIEHIIDFSLLSTYKEKLKQYFMTIIKPGDYIFDVGYSGRPEAALSNLLGYPVNSLYIHINSDMAIKRQERYHCHSVSLYQYKPSITGVMREHMLMELGPSTIGYEEHNGQLTPIMEQYVTDFESAFMTKIVQRSALEFVHDFISIFGNYAKELTFQNEAASAVFEYYLHYSKPIDRQIFSTLTFEDTLGEGSVLNALDFWNHDIGVHGLNSASANGGTILPTELSDLYIDGLFVKFYRIMNRWFPKGGRKRELIKRIVNIFVH